VRPYPHVPERPSPHMPYSCILCAKSGSEVRRGHACALHHRQELGAGKGCGRGGSVLGSEATRAGRALVPSYTRGGVSLSRGPGRKSGASLYTRKRLSLASTRAPLTGAPPPPAPRAQGRTRTTPPAADTRCITSRTSRHGGPSPFTTRTPPTLNLFRLLRSARLHTHPPSRYVMP
jgi:hypothetical protein